MNFKKNIILFIFSLCFLITLLIKREFLPYKLNYLTLFLSLGNSVYLIVNFLIPIINDKKDYFVRLVSFFLLFITSGFITFVSISINTSIRQLVIVLAFLNLVILVMLYLKNNKRDLIQIHLFLIALFALYRLLIL